MRLGRSVKPIMLTSCFTAITPGSVSSQFPPCSAARSTITEPGFHRFDHVRGDQFRRRSAGNKCRGDDDCRRLWPVRRTISISALMNSSLITLAYPPPPEPSSSNSISRNSAPHTFDLLLDLQPCVEGAHNRAHAARGANGRQPRNTGTDNHHFRRWHLARRRDLTGKEAPEIIRGFNHGTIPADIRHRRPRIEFLCPADPRH